MKKKTPEVKQSVTLSLSAAQKHFCASRSDRAGVSLSRYFQALIEYDRAKNILPLAMTINLFGK